MYRMECKGATCLNLPTLILTFELDGDTLSWSFKGLWMNMASVLWTNQGRLEEFVLRKLQFATAQQHPYGLQVRVLDWYCYRHQYNPGYTQFLHQVVSTISYIYTAAGGQHLFCATANLGLMLSYIKILPETLKPRDIQTFQI